MSSPSPKLLETTNLPSVSMDLPFSSISYKCNSICGLLCLASCIYNVFKVDPCCFMYQSFISFYSWIILGGMDIAHFVYPFVGWCHFGCLHYLAIMNNVAVNIYAQIFVWRYVSSSLKNIPRRATGGSHGKCMFDHLRNCLTGSQTGCTVNVPTSRVWRLQLLHILANTCH